MIGKIYNQVCKIYLHGSKAGAESIFQQAEAATKILDDSFIALPWQQG